MKKVKYLGLLLSFAMVFMCGVKVKADTDRKVFIRVVDENNEILSGVGSNIVNKSDFTLDASNPLNPSELGFITSDQNIELDLNDNNETDIIGIEEAVVPTGYTKMQGELQIMVDANNKVTLNAEKHYEGIVDVQGNVVTIKHIDRKAFIRVIDEKGNKISGIKLKIVNKADFALDADNHSTLELTTDGEDIELDLDNNKETDVIAIIESEVPKDYKANGELWFAVDSNNKITINAEEKNKYASTEGNVLILTYASAAEEVPVDETGFSAPLFISMIGGLAVIAGGLYIYLNARRKANN